MTSLISPWQFVWYAMLAFLTGWCDIYYMQNGKWMMAAIFTFFLIFYFYAAVFRAGMVITMDEKGVRKKILGVTCAQFSWEELEEVGVASLNLFQKRRKKGRRYLYFSKKVMTDDERFDMCLHWLPKDKIAVTYSPKWLEYAVRTWNQEPVFYNTDRISLGSGQ